MEKKRIIGVDYGSKRVGLAVSDPERKVALPVGVAANGPKLVDETAAVAGRYGATTIVLGESTDYKGAPNAIAGKASAFRDALEERGFEVVMEPEFMTSVQAERLQGKNGMIDASAAALILQSYLDRDGGKGVPDGGDSCMMSA
ncbi:MAG: pre-16S rRNA-processing nuclease YqgF [Patescibacteria group bacterium]|nr:pre-16S rRNA-processing nuclease YqgF [Patescibacteria group bacterium]